MHVIHDNIMEVTDQCVSTIRQGGDIELAALMEAAATPTVHGGDFDFVHVMILTLEGDNSQGISHYMRQFLKLFGATMPEPNRCDPATQISCNHRAIHRRPLPSQYDCKATGAFLG